MDRVMLLLSQAIVIGHCVVALNGPWAFHTGDDARWAQPGFDDSRWETVDLTPVPGAHDPDVGLTGYVPGWTARGHPGYSGFAWYRLHVTLSGGDTLALSGPTDVDDGYTVFVNGRQVGKSGAPYSVQPRLFVMPSVDSAVIAIRVWVSASSVRASPSDAGGIHVAPAIGTIASIRDRYRVQWSQTLWGYIVDGVEPLAFVLLAVLALALRQPWMSLALALTAMVRVNQVTFFWWQFETIGFAETWRAILSPLTIVAWLIAWVAWFRARRRSGRWLAVLAVVLISIGLFAPQLSALHVPGIWFPFGVGVSRTQFAYAAFDLVLLTLFAWTIFTSLPATSRSTS